MKRLFVIVVMIFSLVSCSKHLPTTPDTSIKQVAVAWDFVGSPGPLSFISDTTQPTQPYQCPLLVKYINSFTIYVSAGYAGKIYIEDCQGNTPVGNPIKTYLQADYSSTGYVTYP